jgi:hypothetical protein
VSKTQGVAPKRLATGFTVTPTHWSRPARASLARVDGTKLVEVRVAPLGQPVEISFYEPVVFAPGESYVVRCSYAKAAVSWAEE